MLLHALLIGSILALIKFFCVVLAEVFNLFAVLRVAARASEMVQTIWPIYICRDFIRKYIEKSKGKVTIMQQYAYINWHICTESKDKDVVYDYKIESTPTNPDI